MVIGAIMANDAEESSRKSRRVVPIRLMDDGLALMDENIDTPGVLMSDGFDIPTVLSTHNTEIALDIPTDQKPEEQRFQYGGGYYGRPLGGGYYGRPYGGGYYGGRPGGSYHNFFSKVIPYN